MLTVVAAAVTDRNGRHFLQKRPLGKEHGGLWEFPGGKVEPGETPRLALVRELNEELGIVTESARMEPLAFADSGGGLGARSIVILLYRICTWQGELRPEADVESGWFSLEEAVGLAMPPLDIDLLARLTCDPMERAG